MTRSAFCNIYSEKIRPSPRKKRTSFSRQLYPEPLGNSVHLYVNDKLVRCVMQRGPFMMLLDNCNKRKEQSIIKYSSLTPAVWEKMTGIAESLSVDGCIMVPGINDRSSVK